MRVSTSESEHDTVPQVDGARVRDDKRAHTKTRAQTDTRADGHTYNERDRAHRVGGLFEIVTNFARRQQFGRKGWVRRLGARIGVCVCACACGAARKRVNSERGAQSVSPVRGDAHLIDERLHRLDHVKVQIGRRLFAHLGREAGAVQQLHLLEQCRLACGWMS